MNKVFLSLFLLFFCSGVYAYNYESIEKIPVKLTIQKEILSEKDVYEGEIVNFKSVKTVYYKNKIILRRGEIVPAKVKLVITSGMNGIPASIIFGDFKIKGIPSSQLSNSYEVFGQDRSLWVFPLKWALTPLPPTGSLTNFIKGGHAKVKKDRVITIDYHPGWE